MWQTNSSGYSSSLLFAFFSLCETLTRTEIYLASTVENYCKHNDLDSVITIPRYTEWIVTMWHSGVDTIQEYTGKEFEVTFGDGISDLYRVYTKRMKDGRIKVRSESQQRPDQEYVDLLFEDCFQMVTWLILLMRTRLTNEKIKLSILDSIVNNYKGGYTGRSKFPEMGIGMPD